MTAGVVPRWMWRTVAVVLLLAVVGAFALVRTPPPEKPIVFVSMQGDRLTFLEPRAVQEIGQPPAFEVGIPLKADKDELRAAADKLFEGYAGPKADELGFKRVLIHPDDGSQSGGILGFQIRFHVSFDSSDHDDETLRQAIAYDKGADGKWSSDGAEPGPPPHIENYTLKSGARFILTSAEEDFPGGTFVVECETCRGDTAARDVAANFYDVLRPLSERATHDGLNALKVYILVEARRSRWDFPDSLNVTLKRDGKGTWRAPVMDKLEAVLMEHAQQARAQGAKMRGEAR